MILLGLETATEVCSVALSANGELLARRSSEPRAHARILLPLLDQLLAQAGIAVSQLDGVCFGRGPGSFTGVRIATAAAQAVALARDLPVYPVSNLALIAQRAWREQGAQQVLVAMDARMNQVYWASFSLQQEVMRCDDDEYLSDPESLPPQHSGEIAGNGWPQYPEQLQLSTGFDPTTAVVQLPDAVDLMPFAMSMQQRGEGVAAELASPVYLRNNVALTEAEREAVKR